MGTIDDYIAELSDADRAAVEHLYAIAREMVPGAEQGKGYGMPALVFQGKPLLSVMRMRKHIGVYPFSPAAVTAAQPLLTDTSDVTLDKGTIRFQPDHPLPDEAVRELIRTRVEEIAT